MLRSVIFAIDSATARRVIDRAAHLPFTDGAEITVLETDERSSHGRWSLLERYAHGMVPLCRRVRWASAPFDVSDLLARTRASEADLVVIGEEGFRGWRIARLMGHVPVLVVRAPRPGPYRRPLVALDLSERIPDLVQVVHRVLPSPPPAISAVHVYSCFAQHATRFVSDMLARVGPAGAGWTRYYRAGDPRDVIKGIANEVEADLVVIGSRQRSLTSRVMFGSVGRGVLADVACDVLSVPLEQCAPIEMRVEATG
jgi:nucleotide-binding universal stress UspA family protein